MSDENPANRGWVSNLLIEPKYIAMSERDKEAEEYILQNLYGIIPMEQWHFHSKTKTDPFESFSKEEERKIKRKFRKIKRKARINDRAYSATMWKRINRILLRDMDVK